MTPAPAIPVPRYEFRSSDARRQMHTGWSPPSGEIDAGELVEASLVHGAQQGREEAIAELLRRTRPLVERTVGRLCLDREMVEDLVQSSLLIVLAGLPALRAPEAYISWVQGIVRNLCCKAVRRQEATRAVATKLMQCPPAGFPWVRRAVDPEEVALRSEAQAHLRRALAMLPVHYQRVVTMRTLESYSYEEIGRLLDVPGPLVRLWHFRARQRLRVLCCADEVLLRSTHVPAEVRHAPAPASWSVAA